MAEPAYRGWVRMPHSPVWECVCQDSDYDECLGKLLKVRRPGAHVEKLVSRRDPNVSGGVRQ